jgi:LDH2 family malate/lactate/ureidoglycolate dehydrogenase
MSETVTIPQERLRAWVREVLRAGKVPEEQAEVVADVLVTANLQGVDTHGFHMVATYAERYKAADIEPIRTVVDKAALAMLDGGANLGAYVAVTAMELAIQKAGDYGMGAVLVKNSNHFGPAGYYTRQAALQNFIGFSTTTALLDLAPWGGLSPITGKNPFSVSFPGDEFPLVLDAACSVAARQKVIGCAREGKPIPEGWALDKDGRPTTDAQAALEGLFLPMGGHKGIGIAVMIEHLVAVLCQTGYSYTITKEKVADPAGKTNIGHFFLALDPSVFLGPEELRRETAEFSRRFHACRKAPGTEKLYLPGELEWETGRSRMAEGVPVALSIIRQANAYADSIGVSRVVVV